MSEYAVLEISLHRYDLESYTVEFRFNRPKDDAEIRLGQDRAALARFDMQELNRFTTDPESYGSALKDALFADPSVREALAQARTSVPLRLRLILPRELHRLRWETLRDPQDNTPLCTNENILFSRYLSSRNWDPVCLRSRGDLRALVVVANPTNLDQYKLGAVDVAGEIGRAKAGLGEIPVTSLPGEKTAEWATLENLIACLREEEYDILYLVCHGKLHTEDEDSWLWLQDDAGNVKRVCGSDLVARLKDLRQLPRLVVLASCQSARSDDEGDSLAALGPRLAEAGVPAVLAMQGNVSMDTIASFMPEFFNELQDGQIDRAVAVARGKVRDRDDYWMPALFMRLKSGRIWYVPGFTGEFEKWPTLINDIKHKQCTPILGHGLVEPILGSQHEIAKNWAETFHYPLARHECESLPQVAQYLAINQSRRFLYDGLENIMREKIQTRFRDVLSDELQQGSVRLDDLIEAIGAHQRKMDPFEPHKVLAELDLPIYITTNVDNLLASALKEAGKDPQVVLCPWNRNVERVESIYDREENYRPSVERPLVYHLFGRLDIRHSLVLTEDDYFDYLIGFTSNNKLIPEAMRAALTNSALLFLGFQLTDWSFRALFRSILSREGVDLLLDYAHIAAQIEPNEDHFQDPERARRHLESYFLERDKNKKICLNLYWGSVNNFMEEMQREKRLLGERS